jgi:hypothetical protein
MAPSNAPQLLPWSNAELEALLRDLIDHGVETPKADLKEELDTGTNDGKADLLKDIGAIANTYATEYHDYGFLIYGVTRNAITGVKTTQTDTDKLQSHIEELLKAYLSPMPQIYVIGFTSKQGERWGVVVIPPRNTKPHMFVKNLQAVDAKRSRKRGEWFVRRGSTTDVGLPEDLAVITQRQMDSMLEPLRESVRTLQSRVARTEEQYTSALFKLVTASALQKGASQGPETHGEVADTSASVLGLDLPTRLKQRLQRQGDALANELVSEAMALRELLDGGNTTLPWSPQPTDLDAAANRQMIETLEKGTQQLMASFATILLHDRNGSFTDALLRVAKTLARAVQPSGVGFNLIGPALRDYPLVMLLYTAFVSGTQANSGGILKRLLEIPLRQRGRENRGNILSAFLYVRRAKELFNTAFGGHWCEPIAMRIRQVLSDHIGDLFAGIAEPEYFFRGEFVLALAAIDRGITDKIQIERIAPLPGLYLYLTEANDVIRDFISERPDWLNDVYRNPLPEILRIFDSNWSKAVSSDCIGTGVYGLNASTLYQLAGGSGP